MKKINIFPKLHATVILFLAVCCALTASATTTSWKGTTNTNWNTATNWTNGAPTSTSDVIIGDGSFTGSFQPNVNVNSTCASLILGNASHNSVLAITASSFTVSGNVTIGANGSVTHNTGSTWNITGSFTNSGSYTGSSLTSIISFNGTLNQTLTGTTNFKSLTVNNAAGLALASNINISGTLKFSNGKIMTGSNLVYIQSGGTVTNTNAAKYVYGNLKKDIGLSTTSITFEVGDAAASAILSFTGLSVTAAGTLTVQTNSGDHASLNTSSFSSSRTVNRCWSLLNSSIMLSSGTVTASFNASDKDAGLSTANCQIGFWNGSSWSYPAPGTRTATSTQATGITALRDIQIGEYYSVPALSSLSLTYGNVLQTYNVVFTGTGYVSGVSSVNPGSGITVNSVTVTSATSLTANITITSGAATGARNFSVINFPGGGTSGNKTFTVNPPLPVLSSIAASSGILGQTMSVIFTGANFSAGVSSVTVGTGITLNSTTVNSATQITANITISAATTAGVRSFYVTNSGGGGSSASQSFTVNNPLPTLSGITPTSGSAGNTQNVTFTGTNFINGVSFVNVGSGITINSTTVNSSTSITANITLSSSAIGGARSFSVTNLTPGGGTSANQTFTLNNLAPTMSGISLTSGTLGNTSDVTFTGTNFVSGVSTPNVGAGITVNSTTVNSSTSLTTNISIAAGAATGTRNFSVTNAAPGGGTSTSFVFTINQPPPVLNSINITSGTPGQVLSVIFTGSNFVSGVSSVQAGTGLTVGTTTVNSSTQITASITITTAALAGTRNFTVTNSAGGGVSAAQTFTVNNLVPTLTSLSVLTGVIGQTMNVVFTGTNFRTGVSSVNCGADITVNSTTVSSATSITANITVSAFAIVGTRAFSVTNSTPGGGTTSSITYTINNPLPTLTTISPTSGNRLQTFDITFTGTNFMTGVSSVNVGAGITVNTTTVNSSTTITANITITTAAATGARNFSVTNSGGGGTSANKTFTVNNPAPTLTALSPTAASQNQTTDVIFTGTNFISGVTTATLGTGITQNSITVTSPTSMTVNITVAAGATLGTRNFTAANPAPGGGTSAIVTFNINNNAPTLSGVSPATGILGQTLNVVFTGTHFINGTSSVNVGSNITVNSTTVSSAASITANLTISSSAATGARNFSVTNTAIGTSSNQVFTINNPAPSLTSISPASSNSGQTLNITLTGSGFINGVSSVNVGSDLTLNSTTVNSSTSITANITASGTAIGGTRNISVTNATPGGGSSANQAFTINNLLPALSGISPSSGIVGETLNVGFTGTNFLNGVSSVTLGTGITLNSLTVSSSTYMIANITISGSASAGTRNFFVTNATPAGGNSASRTFTVNNPSPTLTSISPASATSGQTLNVTFTGTNFISGVSTVTTGTNMTVNSVTVNSATSIVANISLASSIIGGTRNVSVSNTAPGGGTSANQTFTINNPSPSISGISPSTANRLATLNITFTGTNFISGVTALNSVTGFTVNSTTINSSTSLTANITVLAAATLGVNNFTISNASPAGGTSGNAALTISNPAPGLTGIFPASGNHGDTFDVTFTGTNFIQGVSTARMGTGITVNSNTVNSSTSLTANITISNSATLGARLVNILNSSPNGGNSPSVTFTVTANQKTFIAASGNWNDASNWSPAVLPLPGESVVIPLETTAYILTGENYDVEGVSIEGHLQIENTAMLNCNGNLAITSSGILSLEGDFPTYSTISVSGVIEYTGNGNQTIANNGIPFQDLKISGAGTKTLSSDVVVNDNVIIEGTLDAAGFIISVKKDWINNGTYIATNGEVIFSGTSGQTISGTAATEFYNMTITNTAAAGVSLGAGENLQGTLTLSANSKMTTTGYTFTFLSTATETARLAIVPASANFVGNITMQRFVPGNLGYRILGSAVHTPQISDINDNITVSGIPGGGCPACAPNLWVYDETAPGNMNNTFVVPSAINYQIPLGQGIFMKRNTASSCLIDLTGSPNIGTVAYPVTYTPSVPPLPLQDGWFLASNVYPCDIDWDSPTGWTKTNMASTYYTWDPSISDYRFYQSGLGGNGSKFIASSQGFWVKATAANPVLIVNENAKVTSSNPLYRLNTHNQDKMTLTMTDNSDTSKSDNAYIRFMPSGNENFDPENDSHRLYSTTSVIPNIATWSFDNVMLAVNTMPALDHNYDIPVIIRNNTSGLFTISSADATSFPSSACIVLEDLVTGTKTDLKAQSYTCNIVADSSATPRFILHIAPPVKLDITESTCARSNDGMVIAKGQDNGPWTFNWKDASGTVIKSRAATMNPDTIFNLPAGNYSLEVNNSAGYCLNVSESFTITEPLQIEGNPFVSNVTCNGNSDGKIALFVTGGIAPYDLYWSNGSTDPSGSIGHLAPGSYDVMINDANGCISYSHAEITQPEELEVSIKTTLVSSCKAANGTALVTPLGGTGPYTYKWSNDSITGIMTGLAPGKISVTVTDNQKCAVTSEAVIEKAESVSASFTISKNNANPSSAETLMFSNASEGAAQYSWDFGDGFRSTEKNPEHYYSTPGDYSVKLIAENNGCNSSYELNLSITNNNSAYSGINISPNPNPGEYLKIELPSDAPSEVSFKIYNESGKMMLSKSVNVTGNSYALDLTDGGKIKLHPGIYVLSVIMNDHSLSKKLVISDK